MEGFGDGARCGGEAGREVEPERWTEVPGDGGRLLLPDRVWLPLRAGGAVAGRARVGPPLPLSPSASALARTGPPVRKARMPGPLPPVLPGAGPGAGPVRPPMQKPMVLTDGGAEAELLVGAPRADGDEPRLDRARSRTGESPRCAGESLRRPGLTPLDEGLSCRLFGEGLREDGLEPGLPPPSDCLLVLVRESRILVAGPLVHACNGM